MVFFQPGELTGSSHSYFVLLRKIRSEHRLKLPILSILVQMRNLLMALMQDHIWSILLSLTVPLVYFL